MVFWSFFDNNNKLILLSSHHHHLLPSARRRANIEYWIRGGSVVQALVLVGEPGVFELLGNCVWLRWYGVFRVWTFCSACYGYPKQRLRRAARGAGHPAFLRRPGCYAVVFHACLFSTKECCRYIDERVPKPTVTVAKTRSYKSHLLRILAA